MSKVIHMIDAIKMIKDGDTLCMGGFLGVGTPEPIIDALVESNKRNFTLISNDTAFVDKGVGKMVVNKQFKKIIATHIGTNKETGRQMNEGETEVILIPQGSLSEMLRAKAYGLGGVLTPTGIGTKAEEGKKKIRISGKDYILEEAIGGDVSLMYADIVDELGNMYFTGSTQNFNVPMAGASKINIVYAEKLVSAGQLDPNHIRVPGVFVDYIIDGGKIDG